MVVLNFRPRFSIRTLLIALTVLGVLLGCGALFVRSLSRVPDEVELVTAISPSSSGKRVAFIAYHGGYDDEWTGVRDFIAEHSGYNTYPDSVRAMLLETADDRLIDLGPGELGSGPIALPNDESMVAFVSSRISVDDDRKRLQLFDFATGTTSTAFVGSDWYLRSLIFSPDSRSLAFIENYNGQNLVVLDLATGSTSVVSSGVNSHYLAWAVDGKSIFCIRKGLEIWRIGVDGKSKELVFTGKDLNENHPYHLVTSPDGKLLGFGYAWGFSVLDLETGETKKLFACDHYFLTFDWSDEGICYLDAVGAERQKEARVMVYDLVSGTSKEVVVGPFAYVSWLRKGVLIVRKHNSEIWEVTIESGAMKRLFPLSR